MFDLFKAYTSNISLLTDSIATIAEIIDEGIFKISKSSISMTAADRAMVAVIDLKISSKAFDSFDTDKEYNIGMNIASLLSVLKRAGGNDKATISLLDSKLEIVLQNSSKRRFTIPLLDISQEEVPPIDQLQFDTKAEIKSDILQRGIEDAEVVSDSVLFEASEDSFFMKAEGDISSAHLELEKGSQSLISIKTNGDTRARYPVDYLKKMIKATKIADKVILEWSKDYPMKLTFNSEDKISLNMILAPRVTEE